MQLGAHKQTKHNMPGALASELEAWGNDDLIDLDADEADWSEAVYSAHICYMLMYIFRCIRRSACQQLARQCRCFRL